MPKFNKTEDQLETMMDKWLYVLRNLSRLMERPAALQDRVFTRLFEQAEIARFSKEELFDYEESLKVYRDLFNVVNSAEQKGIRKGFVKGKAEGLEEGIAKGKAEGLMESNINNARRMKAKGYPLQDIADITELTIEDVNNL